MTEADILATTYEDTVTVFALQELTVNVTE